MGPKCSAVSPGTSPSGPEPRLDLAHGRLGTRDHEDGGSLGRYEVATFRWIYADEERRLLGFSCGGLGKLLGGWRDGHRLLSLESLGHKACRIWVFPSHMPAKSMCLDAFGQRGKATWSNTANRRFFCGCSAFVHDVISICCKEARLIIWINQFLDNPRPFMTLSSDQPLGTS